MSNMKVLTTLAVLTISVLGLYNFWVSPAFAIEGVHSVTGMTSTEMYYNGGANTYVSHTASTVTIEKISPTAFTRTTASLPAGTYNGRGDCSLTTDVCVWTTSANLIRAVKADGTQLWSVTADSSATTGAGFTDIIEDLNVVLVSVVCSANTNRILQEYDLGTGVFIKNVGNCAGTALGNAINTANGHYTSATEYALTMQGSGQVGNFQIWNISPITPTRTCTWATVTTLVGSEGDIIKLGTTYYISDGTTMQALTTACADTTDIGSGTHGMSTIINLFKSTVRNEYYVEDITGFAVMNSSSTSQKLGEITCTATSATDPSIFADEFIQVACLDDTGDIVTVIEIASVGDNEAGGGGSANGVCLNVDANGDGKINVLDCAGTNTAWAGITAGRNATDIAGSITDGLGLTSCGEDGDPKVCGSGLYMFAFMLLLLEFLALAGYLGFTTKANA